MVEKCLSSTRPIIKQNSLEALLLYIELDVAAPVIEEVLPGLGNKVPKNIAATLHALTQIVHNYGCKIVDPKPILKALPKAFGAADKNVRAEATALAVELYRWLREAMKPMFWGDLKPTQQTDLEAQFEKVKAEGTPKQERLLRSQQEILEAGGGGGEEGEEDGEEEAEEPAEIDAFALAEPEDVLKKMPPNFNELLASSKWKDRKDAVDGLYQVLNVPRIKDGDFHEVTRGLAKCMKDANVAVVTQAAQCIDLLAKGLRHAFGKYRTTVMQPIMERLKEKKAAVADALGGALDATFVATSLTDCLEDIGTFLVNKNPQVKEGTMKFLIRCLRTTRDVPSKPEIAQICEAGKKLLSESSPAMRDGGAEIFGTIMKIIGERAMTPNMEGLDDIRKTKIKEFFEAAEVKAKEKPKPVPKPAPAAAPKKVVGGKKPALGAKKAAPAEAPPAAKSAGSKLGLPKTGGLKAPQKRTLGAASPRRSGPIMPSDDDDDEPLPPTPQPKSAPSRGLTGRSLAKPAAAPVQMPAEYSPPPPSGVNAIERAELEELRTANDRLTRHIDDLRQERSKFTSEIQELKNQNASLIEDHTRDVLSIKAKETQLVRARSDAEAAEQINDRLRRELDRLKKALGRAESLNASNGKFKLLYSLYPALISDESNIGITSPTHDDAGIYRDSMAAPSARNRMSFASTMSEEKENGDAPYPRNKFSPELRYAGSTGSSGRGSPARGFRNIAQHDDGSDSTVTSSRDRPTSSLPQGGSNGVESWRRAAEVTSQLKARIEQMKVCKTSYE
jgi:cytoskeleton-associated protein 5